MEGKLIGFVRFTSKKGAPVCKASLLLAASARQLEAGSSSVIVDDVMLFGDMASFLMEKDIGHVVSYTYNRRGFLDEFIIEGHKNGN